MKFTKVLLSVFAMTAFVGSATASADDGGAIAGAVVGGIIGGLIGQAGGHPGFPGGHPGGGPGGPGGWGHPPHPGPGGPGGPGRPHPGPGPGPGPGGPGGPGRPHPGPGGPGYPPPPPPPPQIDLCTGIYMAQNGRGDYVQLTEQGRGYINVTAVSARQAFYGSGSCVMTGPSTAQYNFQLQFGGVGHVNSGTIYRANDGRYYLQGTQDNGPVYVYVR